MWSNRSFQGVQAVIQARESTAPTQSLLVQNGHILLRIDFLNGHLAAYTLTITILCTQARISNIQTRTAHPLVWECS